VETDVEQKKSHAVSDNEAIGDNYIPGGSFLVARKIYKSRVWLKPPFYLKAWLWILGNANHSDRQGGGYNYKRGELVTTYDEMIKGIAYYYRNAFRYPTLKQVRTILNWLKTEGMIKVNPLRRNEGQSEGGLNLDRADLGADLDPGKRADPKARERAYVGIKISVVNYDTYQVLDNYKRADLETNERADPKAGERAGGSSLIGHNNKNVNNDEKNIYGHFATFWDAYPKKVKKKDAFKIWQELERTEDIETLLPVMLDVIERRKKEDEEAQRCDEFIEAWPHPTTWLRDARWEDQPEFERPDGKL
jgi:hypothetical protein